MSYWRSVHSKRGVTHAGANGDGATLAMKGLQVHRNGMPTTVVGRSSSMTALTSFSWLRDLRLVSTLVNPANSLEKFGDSDLYPSRSDGG